MTRTLAAGLLILVVTLISPMAVAEKPKVMASLHPLALLTAEIAGNEVTINTLVPAGGSPHTYSMRPSERRQLQQADLFVWIGPDMEVFLERVMEQPDLSEKSLQLQGAGSGSGSSGHAHSHSHKHRHNNDHGHHHDHSHSEKTEQQPPVLSPQGPASDDPHLWLDPALALPMAERIAEALSAIEGINGEAIAANLAAFEDALEQTLDAIREQLAPHREMAIFTYHDAFRRYGDYFALNIAGHLTINPERSPGARRVAQLRDRLQQEEAPCIMVEPQFNRDWWQGISGGMTLGISVWDPLGSEIAVEQGGYLAFLQNLADQVSACRD
ncbi:MAG: ABC transporter substrate-binding protein [Halomonadaceae bacterium]|nr:MAG: ABC transporter substrate-binding protein [Halomonadaceae bacterium]